ncbi:transposase, partial [Mitsuokella jalaludinii]|uniref:transposase n=1 Tax=Mitsuokella jalaludinii TaxID=187979 RepID=UPI003F89306F
MTSLYTETSVIGRLLSIFSTLFPSATKPTRYLLTWFLIGQLALESAPSVRCLYRQFLSRQTDKALTSYYHALANEHVTDRSIRQALADKALQLISPALRNEPIFLSIDDTTIAKAGKHFDGVSILY